MKSLHSALLVLLTCAGSLVAQEADPEIRRVASRDDVRQALANVVDLHAASLRDHIALTEIAAPPFGEERRAARFAELLRDAGADSVWIDAEGNVLARRRGAGAGETVVLSAHLDTVFPEGTDVTVRVRGDTLIAPGVGDDTRGLVVILTVLRALEAAGVTTEGDVLFVGTVGEEGVGDLRGVKHLFRDGGPRVDAFISVDGSDPARIVQGALGSHRYRVTFRGPGGHSWGAFGLANPHHALGTAVARFVARADSFTASGPRTSYNVGRVGGGTSVNSIPFESWMEVDMRSLSPAQLVAIDSILQRAAREGLADQSARRRRGPALDLEMDMIGDRPSGEIPVDHPFVQLAAAATRHFGLTPEFETSSTDSNVPIARGIPAITIGGGGIGVGAHSPGEYWVDQDSDLGIQRVLLITVAAAGLP